MTPTTQPTRYEEIRRQECPDGCGKGYGSMPVADGRMHYSDFGSVEPSRPAKPAGMCTAPTELAVIERQAEILNEADRLLDAMRTPDGTTCAGTLTRIMAVGAELEDARNLIERQAARITELEQDGPGTLRARFRSVLDFAKDKCGHSPLSAKAGEGVLMDAFERQARQIEELRKALTLAHSALLEGAQSTLETLKKPGIMNGLNVHCRRAHEAIQAALKEETNARS